MTATIHLDDPATVETIDVDIEVDADPTAATPQFAITAVGASPSSWSNGSWSTGWSGLARRATARTPTIGATGTLVVAADTSYDLWWRVTLVAETPVRRVARITVS